MTCPADDFFSLAKMRLDPSAECETAALVADLVLRARDLEDRMPGKGVIGYGETCRMFELYADVMEYARQVCILLGIDVDAVVYPTGSSSSSSSEEGIPRFDFSFPTYAELEQEAQVIYDILTSGSSSSSSSSGGDGQTDEYDFYWFLAKLFKVLGIKNFFVPVAEILQEEIEGLKGIIRWCLHHRDWTTLKLVIKRMLDVMMTRRFRTKLITRIGLKGATKFLAWLGGRLIPIIGWSIIIGSVIWAIGEEKGWWG